jgi:hypothetical protein
MFIIQMRSRAVKRVCKILSHRLARPDSFCTKTDNALCRVWRKSRETPQAAHEPEKEKPPHDTHAAVRKPFLFFAKGEISRFAPMRKPLSYSARPQA